MHADPARQRLFTLVRALCSGGGLPAVPSADDEKHLLQWLHGLGRLDVVVPLVEQNRVLMYPAAEFFYESPDVVAVPIVPQGELIPKEEESYNHTARPCRVGPDNKLYIALGQPFNPHGD